MECIDYVNASIDTVDAVPKKNKCKHRHSRCSPKVKLMEEFKKYKHNPPHLFIPDSKYFVTSSTYNRKRIFINDESKSQLLEYIKKSTEYCGWKLEDWVILDNHFHLMLEANERPGDLSKIIGNIHRFSAIWIKKNLIKFSTFEKIWYNYWDTCITYEKSYFARLNYIWFNPVKHRYVENPENWIHGSYYYRALNEKGYLSKIYKDYPFDKLNIEEDY